MAILCYFGLGFKSFTFVSGPIAAGRSASLSRKAPTRRAVPRLEGLEVK